MNILINKHETEGIPVATAGAHGVVDEGVDDERKWEEPGDEVVVALLEGGMLRDDHLPERSGLNVCESVEHLGGDEGGPQKGGHVEIHLVRPQDLAHVGHIAVALDGDYAEDYEPFDGIEEIDDGEVED